MDPTIYLALAFGASFSNGTIMQEPANSPANPMEVVQHGYSPTGRAAIGLSLNRWDFEVGAGFLGKWHTNRAGGDAYDTTGQNTNRSEIDLRARYNLPVSQRWTVYGEAGVAFVKVNDSQWTYCGCDWVGGWVPSQSWGVAPQIGAGVGYDLAKRWRITAGVTYTGMQDTNTTQLMIGGKHSFK